MLAVGRHPEHSGIFSTIFVLWEGVRVYCPGLSCILQDKMTHLMLSKALEGALKPFCRRLHLLEHSSSVCLSACVAVLDSLDHERANSLKSCEETLR